jgi:hypothetical protein
MWVDCGCDCDCDCDRSCGVPARSHPGSLLRVIDVPFSCRIRCSVSCHPPCSASIEPAILLVLRVQPIGPRRRSTRTHSGHASLPVGFDVGVLETVSHDELAYITPRSEPAPLRPSSSNAGESDVGMIRRTRDPLLTLVCASSPCLVTPTITGELVPFAVLCFALRCSDPTARPELDVVHLQPRPRPAVRG